MLSSRTIGKLLIASVIFGLVVAYISDRAQVPNIPAVTLSAVSQEDKVDSIEQVADVVPETDKETVTSNQLIPEPPTESLPVFTSDSLAMFSGEDLSLPIYVAYEGVVYNVTEGKKFYGPDGHYNFLAGTDSTKLLKIFGGDIIKKKYPVVGKYRE
jgi:predicted heme/steroid binding protein